MDEELDYIYDEDDIGYDDDIEEVNFDHHQDYRKDFFENYDDE